MSTCSRRARAGGCHVRYRSRDLSHEGNGAIRPDDRERRAASEAFTLDAKLAFDSSIEMSLGADSCSRLNVLLLSPAAGPRYPVVGGGSGPRLRRGRLDFRHRRYSEMMSTSADLWAKGYACRPRHFFAVSTRGFRWAVEYRSQPALADLRHPATISQQVRVAEIALRSRALRASESHYLIPDFYRTTSQDHRRPYQ